MSLGEAHALSRVHAHPHRWARPLLAPPWPPRSFPRAPGAILLDAPDHDMETWNWSSK